MHLALQGGIHSSIFFSRLSSDLMFVLFYWLFREPVVQWPQEHPRERRGRVDWVEAVDAGGAYFLYKY